MQIGFWQLTIRQELPMPSDSRSDVKRCKVEFGGPFSVAQKHSLNATLACLSRLGQRDRPHTAYRQRWVDQDGGQWLASS